MQTRHPVPSALPCPRKVRRPGWFGIESGIHGLSSLHAIAPFRCSLLPYVCGAVSIPDATKTLKTFKTDFVPVVGKIMYQVERKGFVLAFVIIFMTNRRTVKSTYNVPRNTRIIQRSSARFLSQCKLQEQLSSVRLLIYLGTCIILL